MCDKHFNALTRLMLSRHLLLSFPSHSYDPCAIDNAMLVVDLPGWGFHSLCCTSCFKFLTLLEFICHYLADRCEQQVGEHAPEVASSTPSKMRLKMAWLVLPGAVPHSCKTHNLMQYFVLLYTAALAQSALGASDRSICQCCKLW